MKRTPGETRDHHTHRLLMSRSATMYRSLQERHNKAGIAPLTESLATFREWLRGQIGTTCEYCGKTLTVKECSIDHPTPLARGGDGTITVICSGCNKAKSAFTRAEFLTLRQKLAEIDAGFPDGKVMAHVLRSLKIANSFRFGSDRRAKEAKNK